MYSGKSLHRVGGHICERDLQAQLKIATLLFEVEEAKYHEPRAQLDLQLYVAQDICNNCGTKTKRMKADVERWEKSAET